MPLAEHRASHQRPLPWLILIVALVVASQTFAPEGERQQQPDTPRMEPAGFAASPGELILGRGSGQVGDEVGVSGGDWQTFSDEVRIDVGYEPDNQDPPQNDPDRGTFVTTVDLVVAGEFSSDREIAPGSSFRVPFGLDPGVHTVFGCMTSSDEPPRNPPCSNSTAIEDYPTQPFRVLEVSTSSNSGQPGDTLDVEVDGFASPSECGDVIVRLGNRRVGTVTPSPTSGDDSHGGSTSITVPSIAAGDRTLMAEQPTCDHAAETSVTVRTLEVDPDRGQPGSSTAATGGGFGDPGECGSVALTFDGTQVATVTPTSEGEDFWEFGFVTTFDVPERSPGGYDVVAIQQGCGVRVITTFTIPEPADPTLEVDPEEGTIETEVEATGSDFEPGVEVELRIGEVELATVPGDDVGDDRSFTVTFELPEGVPGGEQDIVACQECDTDDELAASATFLVLPRIEVEREVVARGSVLRVDGDGFPTDQPVTLTWDPGIGVHEVAGDDVGEFRAFLLIFRRDHTGPRELIAEIADPDLADGEEPLTLTEEVLVVPGSIGPPDFSSRG